MPKRGIAERLCTGDWRSCAANRWQTRFRCRRRRPHMRDRVRGPCVGYASSGITHGLAARHAARGATSLGQRHRMTRAARTTAEHLPSPRMAPPGKRTTGNPPGLDRRMMRRSGRGPHAARCRGGLPVRGQTPEASADRTRTISTPGRTRSIGAGCVRGLPLPCPTVRGAQGERPSLLPRGRCSAVPDRKSTARASSDAHPTETRP